MAKPTLKVRDSVSAYQAMLDSPKHGLKIIYSVLVQLMKPANQLKVIPD